MVEKASRRAEAEGIKYNAAQKLQFHRIDVAGNELQRVARHRLNALDILWRGMCRSRCEPRTQIQLSNGKQTAGDHGGRAAGRRTGGDAFTLRSEGHIPRRSIRSCAVGC